MTDSPNPPSPPPSAPPVRKPRRRWRWHVPPALVQGGEALEGAEVLDEVQGPLGVLLWQSMRDVTLWAGVREPEEREGLFQSHAEAERQETMRRIGVDAALDAPLRAIAAMMSAPETAEERDVLLACRQVSEWADGHGHLATALAFATAGAVAAPANAAAGFRVGQLARRRAEYARAETWFRRTIGLGRQSRDWSSYADAFLGLGNLYVQRGNFPAARRFHIRGLRAARRHGMRDIQARALHDLFGIAVESGQVPEAQEFARAAFRAYGSSHPRLPALAHDLAYFWMTRGHFASALSVFQALLPHFRAPELRALALGDIGRAAGGAGDRRVFEEAWRDLWSLAHETTEPRENSGQALLDLAHGAASLNDWSRADTAANAAREIAEKRSEARVVLAADAVLDSVRGKRALETRTRDEVEVETEGLAEELVRTLTETAAGD